MNLIKSYTLYYKDKKKNRREKPEITIYYLDEERIKSKTLDVEDEYVPYVVDMLRNEKPVYWDKKEKCVFTLEETAGKHDADTKGAVIDSFDLVKRYKLYYSSKKERHKIFIYYDKDGDKQEFEIPVGQEYIAFLVDMLRNEKPVYWNAKQSVLRTTLEETGTGEKDSKKGLLDKYELVDNYALIYDAKAKKPKILVNWRDVNKNNVSLGRYLNGEGRDMSYLVDLLRNEKPVFFNPTKEELRTGYEPTGTEETDIASSDLNNVLVVDRYSMVYFNQTNKQKIVLYWKDPQNPLVERSRDLYVPEEMIPYVMTMLRYEKPVFFNDEMGDLQTGMEPAGTAEIDNQAMSVSTDKKNYLVDNYMLMYNVETQETKLRLNWKDVKNPLISYSHDLSINNQNILFVVDMLRNEKPVFWNIKKDVLSTLEEPTSVGDLTPQMLLRASAKLTGIPELQFDSSVEPIADTDDDIYPIVRYKAAYDFKKDYHVIHLYYTNGTQIMGVDFPVEKEYISYVLNILQNEKEVWLNVSRSKLFTLSAKESHASLGRG